ncbi:hypothetical protein AB1N83_001535, partial [Pleurotus pulmonarius]
CRRQRAQSL